MVSTPSKNTSREKNLVVTTPVLPKLLGQTAVVTDLRLRSQNTPIPAALIHNKNQQQIQIITAEGIIEPQDVLSFRSHAQPSSGIVSNPDGTLTKGPAAPGEPTDLAGLNRFADGLDLEQWPDDALGITQVETASHGTWKHGLLLGESLILVDTAGGMSRTVPATDLVRARPVKPFGDPVLISQSGVFSQGPTEQGPNTQYSPESAEWIVAFGDLRSSLSGGAAPPLMVVLVMALGLVLLGLGVWLMDL